MINLKNYKVQNIKNDILSGMVVAVALVPEAIAFSFIAGVSPLVGLYAAFIIGLVTSLIGGRPGMISGATGAVAIVLVGLGVSVSAAHPQMDKETLRMLVLHYIFLTSILAGILQVLVGVFKMGKFIRLVPQPALFGFVNGLAIVIASSQLAFLKPDNYENIDGFFAVILASFDQYYVMYIIIAITMIIMYTLPKITKAIPSGLAAIISITAIVYFVGIDTKSVADLANISGGFPSFVMPDASLLNYDSLKLILPYAVIVALVGLIESLLTL